MKIRILCLLLSSYATLFAFQPEKKTYNDAPPATIKVLLKKNIDAALVEVKGKYQVRDPHKNKKLSSGLFGKRFALYPCSSGIKWGEEYVDTFQIQILPLSAETTLFLDGIQYRGAFCIYAVDGKLEIVNQVDVESYLRSTLTSLDTDQLESTTLDTMAIIARTNAYYVALFNHDAFWHVDAANVDYNGFGLTLQNIRMEKAINDTRYLVMTYDDQPFPTKWHEHCAGRTASYGAIFRKSTPTPEGIFSEFATTHRKHTQWSFTLPIATLAKTIKLNRITDIKRYLDPLSHKVYALQIEDGIHRESMSFFDFQQMVGPDQLQSNDFTVAFRGEHLYFEGYGEGDGVGLCLYSANALAQKGEMAPQILAQFFPCTHIEKMRCYPKMILSQKTENAFVSPLSHLKKKMQQSKKPKNPKKLSHRSAYRGSP